MTSIPQGQLGGAGWWKVRERLGRHFVHWGPFLFLVFRRVRQSPNTLHGLLGNHLIPVLQKRTEKDRGPVDSEKPFGTLKTAPPDERTHTHTHTHRQTDKQTDTRRDRHTQTDTWTRINVNRQQVTYRACRWAIHSSHTPRLTGTHRHWWLCLWVCRIFAQVRTTTCRSCRSTWSQLLINLCSCMSLFRWLVKELLTVQARQDLWFTPPPHRQSRKVNQTLCRLLSLSQCLVDLRACVFNTRAPPTATATGIAANFGTIKTLEAALCVCGVCVCVRKLRTHTELRRRSGSRFWEPSPPLPTIHPTGESFCKWNM